MTADPATSFDRMRSLLNRAAEIRDSEQQQVFDSLDEIHARLAALDVLGTVRKRLSDLPDRTEVGALAERLAETAAYWRAKVDAQDAVLATVARAVEALPDKLGGPIAQLDGRLDGVAGRMEGISGRMDGLDDRLGGLHKRLDELDHRLDRHELRLDALPSSVGAPIRERVDAVERTVREHLDAATRSLDETGDGLRNLLGDTSVGLHRRLEDLAARPAVDPSEPLDAVVQRLEALAGRLDALDEGVSGRLGSLDGSLSERLARLESVVSDRPDVSALSALVERANAVSEQRNAGQLDEAMATFAEIILGRGSATGAPPRPAPRRTPPRGKPTLKSMSGAMHPVDDDPDH